MLAWLKLLTQTLQLIANEKNMVDEMMLYSHYCSAWINITDWLWRALQGEELLSSVQDMTARDIFYSVGIASAVVTGFRNNIKKPIRLTIAVFETA